LPRYNLISNLALLITLVSGSISANDVILKPDEAFLEFLASMSEVNGEMNDPLDMLDITDNEVQGIVQNKESQNIPTDTQLSPKLKPELNDKMKQQSNSKNDQSSMKEKSS